VFLVAVKSLRLGHYWPRFAWTLTGGIVVTIVLHMFFGWRVTDYVQLLLMLALFVGLTVSALRQVLFEGDIDTNKVVGSVALFILIGLTWTVLYLLMIEMDPEAFRGMTQMPWEDNFSQASYFSFVTLTTLGYGDISPASRFVEVLVYIQAIVGVFYMAVFVASLINAAQREKPDG
jgi:voltage-gated potassium channel